MVDSQSSYVLYLAGTLASIDPNDGEFSLPTEGDQPSLPLFRRFMNGVQFHFIRMNYPAFVT